MDHSDIIFVALQQLVLQRLSDERQCLTKQDLLLRKIHWYSSWGCVRGSIYRRGLVHAPKHFPLLKSVHFATARRNKLYWERIYRGTRTRKHSGYDKVLQEWARWTESRRPPNVSWSVQSALVDRIARKNSPEEMVCSTVNIFVWHPDVVLWRSNRGWHKRLFYYVWQWLHRCWSCNEWAGSGEQIESYITRSFVIDLLSTANHIMVWTSHGEDGALKLSCLFSNAVQIQA
jgi:hypothetical protein